MTFGGGGGASRDQGEVVSACMVPLLHRADLQAADGVGHPSP